MDSLISNWLKAEAGAGNLAYDRVVFFSDAVFAIAITLLVVDIRVPTGPGALHSGQVLTDAAPQMIGMAISFAVIGQFWIGHHTIFRHIIAFDRRLISLNLFFLATIAFLPYPTALLSAASAQTPAVVFYAACTSAAGLAEAAVLIYAMRSPALVDPRTPARLHRYLIARTLRLPAVFLLSIPVAVVAPGQAPYLWVLVWLIGLLQRRFIYRERPGDGVAGSPGPGGTNQ